MGAINNPKVNFKSYLNQKVSDTKGAKEAIDVFSILMKNQKKS